MKEVKERIEKGESIMKLEEAYTSALLKWELIVDIWDYNNSYKKNMKIILDIFPELAHYPAYCSFCYFWDNPQCHGCPLAKEWGHDCREIDSLYDNWIRTTDDKIKGKNFAEQIRNSVKKIYLKRGGENYESTKELLNRYSLI